MGRRVVFAVAVAVVLIGVLGAVVLRGPLNGEREESADRPAPASSDDRRDGDAIAVIASSAPTQMPPLPADTDAVTAFLEGPGRAIVTFHRMTGPLVTVRSKRAAPETCRSVANELDDAQVTPQDLLDAASRLGRGSVDDEEFSSIVMNDAAVKVDVLRRCDEAADGFADALADAAVTHQVVAQRLEQYGVVE